MNDECRLILGDCLEAMATLPGGSVDAIVTDPPAGIGFMGREWDDFRRAWNPADAGRDNVFGRTSSRGPEYGRRDRGAFIEFMTAAMEGCYRAAKPGAYALVWAIPRTSHWTGMAIEDAGWTVADRISHLFGQGFPKHKSKLKPATEDWWKARKPWTLDAWSNIILQTSEILETWLWLRSSAALADILSTSCPPGLGRRDSVRWLAGTWIAAGSIERSEMMATFNSPEEGSTFWSIALLWSGILDASSGSESTSTIGTGSNQTIALRTLNSFLSATTPGHITRAASNRNGSLFLAEPAGSRLNVERANWLGTQNHSATDPVMLAALNTLVSVAESLSLAIGTSHGVIAPADATTAANYATEDWWLAWKPGRKATPLNIDDCRIEHDADSAAWVEKWSGHEGHPAGEFGNIGKKFGGSPLGRWPANVALSHSPDCNGECAEDCPITELDRQSGTLKSGMMKPGQRREASRGAGGYMGGFPDEATAFGTYGDSGGASRFFFTAKASRSDRGEGNGHPTVKSQALMEWLVKLISKPGDLVLDPFMGSGSTGKAALGLGRKFIGIERDAGYFRIAERRIAEIRNTGPLFSEAIR